MTNRLLELRNRNKKKKSKFVVKDTHKKARVSSKWRKPRGRHSPVRQKHRGRPTMVSVGFGSPKAVKHLHKSGLEKIIIHNITELEKIDSKKQGIMVGRVVGNKKKIAILKLANEKKITILNTKDTKKYLEELEKGFKDRVELKKKRKTEKAAKTKTKKPEEKKEKPAEKPEEKKNKEKEIREKTITKKQ